jgi:predicted amidohydrolase
MRMVTVAACQIDPKLMDNAGNLRKIEAFARDAAGRGAKLIVFPEAAISGYCFESLAEAMPYAEPVPGPATQALASLARSLGVHLVVGLLERDGGSLYNSAVLVGPEGVVATHRKAHLPFLGIDRFAAHGNGPLRVHETPVGAIGMHVCYETTFPETARTMALQGAQVLVLPTNWPEGREKMPEYVVHARALENRVHFIACDRVGEERGWRFIGRSKIVNATGDALAVASADREEIITAEIDLDLANSKRIVFRPQSFEVDLFGDRRPELYGPIGRHAKKGAAVNNRGQKVQDVSGSASAGRS